MELHAAIRRLLRSPLTPLGLVPGTPPEIPNANGSPKVNSVILTVSIATKV